MKEEYLLFIYSLCPPHLFLPRGNPNGYQGNMTSDSAWIIRACLFVSSRLYIASSFLTNTIQAVTALTVTLVAGDTTVSIWVSLTLSYKTVGHESLIP